MSAHEGQPILDLFGIELPIIQAPMAGASTPEMAIAVSEAGGLGSLPTALYTTIELRSALEDIRARTSRPINLNFFCHATSPHDPVAQAAWLKRLEPYYAEAHLERLPLNTAPGRIPFDDASCAIVEEYCPEVVSFHFGLPAERLLNRVRRSGAKIISSATTVAEAVWLENHGVDAVIAMGWEAGGHRGNFLTNELATQLGTIALVPLVVDAITVPVIAAGGIADRRGVAAAFALGASAVQVGTAYLFTPEANIVGAYRAVLDSSESSTAVTNLFTGRPARGIVNRLMSELGPLSDQHPAFPTAGAALAPLRKWAEAAGRADFTPLWAGEAFRLAAPMSAAALTKHLATVASLTTR